MPALFAFGLGIATKNAAGSLLDVYFPQPALATDNPADSGWTKTVAEQLTSGSQELAPAAANKLLQACTDAPFADACSALLDLDQPLTAVVLATDGPITDTAEAYLKLHLLSHRLVLPNTLNLDGIFPNLPNVVWTNAGPIDPADFPTRTIQARAAGQPLDVTGVDKFPKMTNYVIPSGVRIADSARVRLGAYLGEGTTVMHEGFLNFNAGALGPNMVEGRISQGVVVGANSDLGGSSSTMGTLSGGGEIKITVGESCLIGANAGTGIPLGDRCTIEAGLYITAGTPIALFDSKGDAVETVKARQLAGVDDLLFIRNGRSGTIECRANRQAIELNDVLHSHN